MKIKEILSEVYITKAPSKYKGSGVSSTAHRITAPELGRTYTKDAPGFIKAAVQKNKQRKKEFKDLVTGKEKFDFIYFMKEGSSNHRVAILSSDGQGSLKVSEYNRETGDITLQKNRGYVTTVYTGNTNNFEFVKRERQVSGPQIRYIFNPGKLEEIDHYTKPQKQNPKPTKKWDIPNSPW